jgi:hypothetical protein
VNRLPDTAHLESQFFKLELSNDPAVALLTETCPETDEGKITRTASRAPLKNRLHCSTQRVSGKSEHPKKLHILGVRESRGVEASNPDGKIGQKEI